MGKKSKRKGGRGGSGGSKRSVAAAAAAAASRPASGEPPGTAKIPSPRPSPPGVQMPYRYSTDQAAELMLSFNNAVVAGDLNAIYNVMIDAMSLPRQRIGDDSRLVLLLWWWFAKIQTRSDIGDQGPWPPIHPNVEPRVEKRALSVLKFVSNGKLETAEARAVAHVLRADILSVPDLVGMVPTSRTFRTSTEACCRRRACIFASKADPTAIPESIGVPRGKHGFRTLPLRELFLGCTAHSKSVLQVLEGEPICTVRCRLPASFLEDVRENPWGHRFENYEYCVSVGGSGCDYCGKSFSPSPGVNSYKCERCRLSYYCGPECQSMAWDNGHKQHCKQYGVFSCGDHAVLCGLRTSFHLNGGMVRVADRATNGRWRVGFLESGNVRMVTVKTKNLRHHRPFA